MLMMLIAVLLLRGAAEAAGTFDFFIAGRRVVAKLVTFIALDFAQRTTGTIALALLLSSALVLPRGRRQGAC